MPASDRNTARLVGWLFIGTFVFSIPGFLLYGVLGSVIAQLWLLATGIVMLRRSRGAPGEV